MKRSLSSFVFLTFFTVSFFILTTFARGDINYSGDIDPSNPNDWDQYTYAYIGKTSTGLLSITNGGYITSRYGYIGSLSGSHGSVVVDGVDSSWDASSGLYLGIDGSGSVSITNGGSVTNATAAIGVHSGSIGNVVVDGVGSSWDSLGRIYIGRSGSGSLSITNGGHVTSDVGCIGNYSGSQGIVTVSGVGSSWENSDDFYVGVLGGSSLSITNGGEVTTDGTGYIGYKSGSQGSVVVDGVGSSLESLGSLFVGDEGSGFLSIANGGSVTVSGEISVGVGSGDGIINFDGGSLSTKSLLAGSQELKGTGTISTKAFIADTDLVFDSTHGHSQTVVMNDLASQNITINLDADGSGYLGAGYSGSGSMNITEGVRVASTRGYVGYSSGSVGGVVVDGVDSSWNTSGWLRVGMYGNGSVSITNGGNITSNSGRIGFYSGSQGSVVVDGVGSSWNNSGGLTVARDGDGLLSIINGGNVTSGSAPIGNHCGSQGSVTVDGVGSSWESSGWLRVGNEGNGSISIINGGNVTSDGPVDIGCKAGSVGSLIVDGVGSSWKNLGDLFVGHEGRGSILIANGGDLASDSGYIGYSSGSLGSVIVDGVGSDWKSFRSLEVGGAGNGSLSIINGGMVAVADETRVGSSNGSGVINFDEGTLTTKSFLAGSENLRGMGTVNTKGLVSDTNLIFDSTHGLNQTLMINDFSGQNITINLDADGSGYLGAGCSGSGSTSIKAGVVVASTGGYIGYKAGSQGSVVVDGVGSSWNSSDSIHVGCSGRGYLSITNGGNVAGNSGYIGLSNGSLGDVTVDGVGSSWNSSNSIHVGCSGRGSLSITNGGNVTSDSGHIGSSNSSVGNVTVDGAGSSWLISRHSYPWNNPGTLYIGDKGNGSLSITNGGYVRNHKSYIGYFYGSQGNVTVDGVGSSWDVDSWQGISVGKFGRGFLSITNGGTVTSGRGSIGGDSRSRGSVVVDGVGSSWKVAGGFRVGSVGRGSLSITNGGVIESHSGYIGIVPDAVGSVVVDGIGSSWHISRQYSSYSGIPYDVSGFFAVGCRGRGSLSIINGGSVINASGTIGSNSGSVGSVVVDGVDSSWWSLDDFCVGSEGEGSLSITNGGIVTVDGILTIDANLDGDSFVEISAGGMLALRGDADLSITDFLALVQGRDRIRFWDESVHDWRNIMNASIGDDYTLEYISDMNSDLYDHTVLTVPEPITIAIFALGCLGIRRRQ